MYLLAEQSAIGSNPDFIAIGMVAVLALVLIILTIRKSVSVKKNAVKAVDVEVSEVAQDVNVPTAPGSAGAIKLHDVEPKTAAMLMAIVADKMGKPLNELRFISIKEVK